MAMVKDALDLIFRQTPPIKTIFTQLAEKGLSPHIMLSID